MLGAPRLLYYGSGISESIRVQREKVKFINDVRIVAKAREMGPATFIEFVAVECFFYTTFAVMNLHLGTWAIRASVVGLGLGFYLGSVVCKVLVDWCREKLWNRLQLKESFEKAYEAGALHNEWQGEHKGSLPGIHWPRSGLKYRDGKCSHLVLVADQVHRHFSVFCFGVAGVAAFSLLSPVVASVYSVYMGALFLFQQEGLRIYPRSPRLYHIVDLAFGGGILFVAMYHPRLLLFSCCYTQAAFIIFVGLDTIASLCKFLFGEGS